MKDYYQILGVPKEATTEEIRKAFHKLAHKHHPDKGGDEKKFKEINEAYQVLSDKKKRSQYDRFGRGSEGASGFEPGFDFGFGKGKFGEDFEFNFGDMGDIGEMIEEMFGFQTPKPTKDIKKGRDIEIDVQIPLEDTLKGKEKEITLTKMILCPRCQGKGAEPESKIKECFTCRGTGQVQQIMKTFFGSFTKYVICPECGGEGNIPEKPCNVCHGEGRIKGTESIKTFIPAGIDTNQIIRFKHKGEAGRKGGEAGDLYIRVSVKPHPIFKRKGDDLYVSIPINFSQAVLGDSIEIPTLDGSTRASTEFSRMSSPQGGEKILLKVPQGTESGKVLRISRKGIPHFSGYGRGDLYIKLIVKTPKKLSQKQKELIEKLREESL